jgi:DNA-binding transcriptional regulator YiaG
MTAMTDPDSTFADLLLQGAREAAAYATGDPEVRHRSRTTRRRVTARQVELRPPFPPSADEIRTLRDDLGLSQTVFAHLLNVSPSTVRSWEQGQRAPDGASIRLLEIARRSPEALLEAARGEGDR